MPSTAALDFDVAIVDEGRQQSLNGAYRKTGSAGKLSARRKRDTRFAIEILRQCKCQDEGRRSQRAVAYPIQDLSQQGKNIAGKRRSAISRSLISKNGLKASATFLHAAFIAAALAGDFFFFE